MRTISFDQAQSNYDNMLPPEDGDYPELECDFNEGDKVLTPDGNEGVLTYEDYEAIPWVDQDPDGWCSGVNFLVKVLLYDEEGEEYDFEMVDPDELKLVG